MALAGTIDSDYQADMKQGAAKGGGGWQIGICNGVQTSTCPGNIRKIYIYDVLTPTSLSWGMGHMEQGHSELFCVATAVQLTSGMVI